MGDRDTCWLCGGKLIWQSDFSYDECNEKCDCCKKETCDGITTFLICSNCGADVTYNCKCNDYKED